MYKWVVEIWDRPLEDPTEMSQGAADDYEAAVERAAEMAEAEEPYRTVIEIKKEV